MVGGIALSVVLVGGCVTKYFTAVPTAYTLKVNVSSHAKSKLCSQTPDDETATCEQWAVQPLTTPGTLTVELEEGGPNDKFDLRVAQFSREASQEDARKILQEVASRITTLIETAATQLGAGDGRGKAVTDTIIAQIRDRLPDSAARIAKALTDKQAIVPPRLPTSELFKDYLADGAAAGTKRFKTKAEILAQFAGELAPEVNAPAQPEPPPRSAILTADDLAVLASQGLNTAAVAAFIDTWCDPTSFQSSDSAIVAQYSALSSVAPELDAVRHALKLSPREVAAAILERGEAKGDPIAAAMEKLLAEAPDWSVPVSQYGVAHRFKLMRLGTTLGQYMEACKANYTLVGKALPAGFATLETDAAKHAKAFRDIVGPVYVTAITSIETILPLLDKTSFTTLTLEPGKLELGVGRLLEGGGRTEFATYKVQVSGIERLAVFAGPIFTFCLSSWHCYDEIHEGTFENRRYLVKDSEWRDFGLATGLHVTLRSGNRFGIGAIIGYPIGAPNATSANVLAGFGLRHASGVELAIGIHAYRLQALRNPYRTPIDVNDMSSMTVDTVTAPEVRASGFIMLGFAPDIF
jgi:hypothetical protein